MDNNKSSFDQNFETLKDNAASVKESISSLVDQGGATIDAIKAKAGDVSYKVKSEGAAAIERTESLVQQNPFAAVAIAFGIGYVAMRLRTSPFVKLALVGGLGYLGVRVARR